ncbi:MAG TPA: hypothetical protein PKK06_08635 [Phycisphaerae bacterium]|nr:hypothetical protein [Phycisphaerae bacterium]HNU45224.1 hypothetical protein [Phycisphaerae bacterium]
MLEDQQVEVRRVASPPDASGAGFPRTCVVPRAGRLEEVTVGDYEGALRLRTELELLDRIAQAVAGVACETLVTDSGPDVDASRAGASGSLHIGRGGPALPQAAKAAAYTTEDRDELARILEDAGHPAVRTAMAAIDESAPELRKDIVMSRIQQEAENIVQEAIASGVAAPASGASRAVSAKSAAGQGTPVTASAPAAPAPPPVQPGQVPPVAKVPAAAVASPQKAEPGTRVEPPRPPAAPAQQVAEVTPAVTPTDQSGVGASPAVETSVATSVEVVAAPDVEAATPVAVEPAASAAAGPPASVPEFDAIGEAAVAESSTANECLAEMEPAAGLEAMSSAEAPAGMETVTEDELAAASELTAAAEPAAAEAVDGVAGMVEEAVADRGAEATPGEVVSADVLRALSSAGAALANAVAEASSQGLGEPGGPTSSADGLPVAAVGDETVRLVEGGASALSESHAPEDGAAPGGRRPETTPALDMLGAAMGEAAGMPAGDARAPGMEAGSAEEAVARIQTLIEQLARACTGEWAGQWSRSQQALATLADLRTQAEQTFTHITILLQEAERVKQEVERVKQEVERVQQEAITAGADADAARQECRAYREDARRAKERAEAAADAAELAAGQAALDAPGAPAA